MEPLLASHVSVDSLQVEQNRAGCLCGAHWTLRDTLGRYYLRWAPLVSSGIILPEMEPYDYHFSNQLAVLGGRGFLP